MAKVTEEQIQKWIEQTRAFHKMMGAKILTDEEYREHAIKALSRRGGLAGLWDDLTGKSNVEKTNEANLQATNSTNDANLAIANSTNQMQRDIAASNIAMQRETNQQNLDIFNQQRQDAIDDRDYNSPASQRARMLAAGLNPASVQSAESGALTSVSAPTMQSPHDDTQLVTPTLQAPRFDYTQQRSSIGTFLDVAAKMFGLVQSGLGIKGQQIDNSFKKEWNKHQINRAVQDLKFVEMDIRHKKALAVAQELANLDYNETKDIRQNGLKLANDLAEQNLAIMKEDENLKRLQGSYQELVNEWLPKMNNLELDKFHAQVKQFNQSLALEWSKHRLNMEQFKEQCKQFYKSLEFQKDSLMMNYKVQLKAQGLTDKQIDVEVEKMKQQGRQFTLQLFMNSAMTFMNMQSGAATQLASSILRL